MLIVSKVLCGILLLLAVAPAPAQIPGLPGVGEPFDGPSILGRGGPVSGKHGTENIPIRVQASLNATYDTNILGYSVDSSGKLISSGSAGVDANLSASGRKLWRRSFLGLDYGGNYSHYTTQSFYNGTNHQLNMSAGTQLGAKWQLMSQIGAGTSNRFLGGPNVFQSSEFEFLSAPTAELFDSRAYFIGNSTSATYSFNRRQSVRFSGSASAVRRRARGLADMTSYGASGDWVYRLSRRSSMGVSYMFSHYDFTKMFGDSDIQTVGWHIGRKFGRDLDLAAGVTGSKQSTVGIRSVALDPILSAILGRSSGSEVFESNNLIYGYSFILTRRIRRSNASAGAQRSINPGNGYFLTSINHSANANVSHNVSRDLSLGASFGYAKLTSLGFASGAFSGWTGGGNVTYKLTDSFGFNGRVDWRTFDLRQTTFGRTGYRASLGVTYFPRQGIAGLW